MRLYVGNLSFTTTEHDLQDAFGRFGTVTDAKIMIDRETSRSRGFGFITMSSASEGNAAMSDLNGKDLDGRNLTVNEARPREERGGGGGEQRSYGGGDNRRSSGSRQY